MQLLICVLHCARQDVMPMNIDRQAVSHFQMSAMLTALVPTNTHVVAARIRASLSLRSTGVAIDSRICRKMLKESVQH